MSAPELESDTYDVVVIGTGLAESIAAAALAKAGKTVLHLDPNEYYGASQASLTLDELVEYTSTLSSSSSSTSSLSPSLEADRRRYALSLFPAIIPSRGPLIETLIKSDVSKYVSFRMLDSVSIWSEGGLKRVPGSKEEVFKDKSVGLVEKRRLMKFLMFAGGEFEGDELLSGKEERPLLELLEQTFSLPSHLAQSIAYTIAHCSSPSEPALPALRRTRRYLRSLGRYGPGAFLVGQYGGAGEVAQGFCRACAVFGGTYVLGPSARPTSIESKEGVVTLRLPCHPRPVNTKHLISSPEHLPLPTKKDEITSTTAHCIAVLSSLPAALRRAESEEGDEGKEQDDTAVIVFPPADGGSVIRALVTGEGTGSCPAGQFIIYLSTQSEASTNARELLQPFLHRLDRAPLFEAYRQTECRSPAESQTTDGMVILRPYDGTELLTEGLDWEAEQGQSAYWNVMGREEGVRDYFEKNEGEGEDESDMGL